MIAVIIMALTIVQALIELITNDAGVKALAGDRVYSEQTDPKAKRPFVTLQKIQGNHIEDMDGSVGLAHARVQIDFYGDNMDDAEDLAEAVRQSIHGFMGTVAVGSESTRINRCFLDEDLTEFVRDDPGSAAGVSRVSHEYTTSYNVTKPTFA